jgi:hypothetical protein
LLSSAAPAAEPVFPDKAWAMRPPADLGIESEALVEFSRAVGGFGCVVRDGYLTYGWGETDLRKDVASCCKPWFAHFLFLALEQGKIASVDDTILPLEPRLGPLNAALDHKDRAITWRHLANQISCYGVGEKPGEAYDYSDFNMALFFDTLFYKVHRSTSEHTTEDVLAPQLTDLIECQDAPKFDVRGRLAISPRDFCRFGLLYLHEGRWGRRRLLSAEHVRTILHSPLANSIPRTANQRSEMIEGQRSLGGGSNQTDHLGSYSWAWWTNGVDRQGQRHWPAAPEDTYAALGNAGKRALVVIPSLQLIVSWNDSVITTRENENAALGILVAGCSKAPQD